LNPGIKEPEIIMPVSAHPAIDKAAHFLGLRVVHTPLGSDYRADVQAIKAAITSNTILIIASAPQYPHGLVDPIEEIAQIALEHNLPFHVDSCIGGFMLPWVARLGYAVPMFDFAVAGVTSISADVHKYAYGCKGASVLLFRNDSYRYYQFFSYGDWPGGLFGSPSMCGTRGGGPIAAAYASLLSLGEDGFMQAARVAMDTTAKMIAGIRALPGLEIIGEPHMTIVAFQSVDPSIDLMAVADIMEDEYGWCLPRQHNPVSLHLSVVPAHAETCDEFLSNLREVRFPHARTCVSILTCIWWALYRVCCA
jgi:sphinganine-1-phosphate aldolase